MSKKIIITFNSEPTATVGFEYTIQVNGLNLVYDNGLTDVLITYQPFGGTDPAKVEIQGNINMTIDATLAFLKANYVNPIITYQRANNTIEITINTTLFTVVYVGAVNPNLAITTSDISEISTVGLRYFFEYKNKVHDIYLCEIFKKGYDGEITEISGFAIIEKANVNNHLDPIRGGGISLQLDASKDLTLEDLYSEGEQDFSVKLYKNKVLVFQGFLNPDGVYQDYVRDEWKITLDCVDGLGAIANLSFVQDNGLHFTGKMLAIDIIYHCLKRTGILMPINTSVNILYDGLTSTDDIFRAISFDTNRFVRTDNDTIMSCEDVLKSILDIFKACITQWDGEWYIYKPNEIFIEPIATFRRFDITNNYVGNKKINLNKKLGSQIDNFYPHHCGGNQRIEIKGSVGGFRLGYKYGFVAGLLNNSNLVKNGSALSYDNWTIDNSSNVLLNDPLKDHGFLFKNYGTNAGSVNAVLSDAISVTTNDDLSLKISFDVQSPFGSSFVKMQIKAGIYYLDYAPKNNLTPIDDTKNAVWSTDSSKHFIFYLQSKNGTLTIQLPKILTDGLLTVAIVNCQNAGTNSTTFFESIDIVPTQSNNAVQGEFHTVERANRVSSIVKANQTVYNGDNAGVIYLGAIYDGNLNPTTLWNRKNSLDKFPLLRIAAEEELRIAQRPTKVFRGDFYGYIPYLSFININNLGYFMPVEWSYNTYTNVTTCKQLELHVAEINDIVYTYTLDYGETVKPTIK